MKDVEFYYKGKRTFDVLWGNMKWKEIKKLQSLFSERGGETINYGRTLSIGYE